MTTISIVIPHYNDLDNLAVCLDLLDRQTLDRQRFEVIIADNNSHCGLAAVEAVARGRARVISAPEPGAGPTRNRGVEVAQGQALAFIDSDCRPEPDWLRQGLLALKQHPIVGGPVIMEPKDRNAITAVEAFDMVFGFNALQFINKRGFLGSGNLFVRREVFERVGGFRPAVSEDVDWSHRAIALGYSLGYSPGAIVSHPARRQWSDLVRRWERHTRETYLLTREQRLGILRWVLKSWLILASPIPHMGIVLKSKQLPSWRDRLAAIAVLFRIRWYRFLESQRLMFSAPR